jgi:hypothetical protein
MELDSGGAAAAYGRREVLLDVTEESGEGATTSLVWAKRESRKAALSTVHFSDRITDRSSRR